MKNIVQILSVVDYDFAECVSNVSHLRDVTLSDLRTQTTTGDLEAAYRSCSAFSQTDYDIAISFLNTISDPNHELAIFLCLLWEQACRENLLESVGLDTSSDRSSFSSHIELVGRAVLKLCMELSDDACKALFDNGQVVGTSPVKYRASITDLLSSDVLLLSAFVYSRLYNNRYLLVAENDMSEYVAEEDVMPHSLFYHFCEIASSLCISFAHTAGRKYEERHGHPRAIYVYNAFNIDNYRGLTQAERDSYVSYAFRMFEDKRYLDPATDVEFFIRSAFLGDSRTFSAQIAMENNFYELSRASKRSSKKLGSENSIVLDEPDEGKVTWVRGAPVITTSGNAIVDSCDVVSFMAVDGDPRTMSYAYRSRDGSMCELDDSFLTSAVNRVISHSTPTQRRSISDFIKASARPVLVMEYKQTPGLVICDNGSQLLDVREPMSNCDVTRDKMDMYYSLSPVSTAFDPDIKCDIVDEYLMQVSDGDLETLALIEEMMGCMITSDPKSAEHIFILHSDLLDGGRTGGTGKSTLLNLLREMIGARGCSSVKLSSFSDKFALSGMRYKLVNIDGDVASRQFSRIEVSILKQVTGGDITHLGDKYERERDYKIYATQVFCSNQYLRISEDDATNDGLARRLHHIGLRANFLKGGAQYDPTMIRRLKSTPGWRERLLWHAVKGLHRLYANDWSFTEPTYSKRLEAQMQAENNSVIAWLLGADEPMKLSYLTGSESSSTIADFLRYYHSLDNKSSQYNEIRRLVRMIRRDGRCDAVPVWYWIYQRACDGLGISDKARLTSRKFAEAVRQLTGTLIKTTTRGAYGEVGMRVSYARFVLPDTSRGEKAREARGLHYFLGDYAKVDGSALEVDDVISGDASRITSDDSATLAPSEVDETCRGFVTPPPFNDINKPGLADIDTMCRSVEVSSAIAPSDISLISSEMCQSMSGLFGRSGAAYVDLGSVVPVGVFNKVTQHYSNVWQTKYAQLGEFDSQQLNICVMNELFGVDGSTLFKDELDKFEKLLYPTFGMYEIYLNDLYARFEGEADQVIHALELSRTFVTVSFGDVVDEVTHLTAFSAQCGYLFGQLSLPGYLSVLWRLVKSAYDDLCELFTLVDTKLSDVSGKHLSPILTLDAQSTQFVEV